MRDLLVAGGGPVGLATALHAARAGLDVAVVEPRELPVDKACGEGLMPGALAALAALGVDPAGHPIAGICYRDQERTVRAAFRHGPGRGVRRTTLVAALAEALADAGVSVQRRTVRSVIERDDHVEVDGEPVAHLVAADGLHSPVRRMLGLEAPATGPRRYGLRVHLPLSPWTDDVEVHWAEAGEAYVTPVDTDLVGVAILSATRRPFADLLAGFPALAARLEGVTGSAVRGAGPLRQRARRRVQGRVLLVGDAAGYVDALTGEGLALGLAQADAAVRAVVAGRPSDYEREARRSGRRHDLLTRALLGVAVRPRTHRLVVPAAARLPRVFDVAVNQLARPA